MITLTAKIEILAGSGSTVSNITPPEGNNISSVDYIKEKKQNVTKPFILGTSKLDGQRKFSSGEKYFISKETSNENGTFANSLAITIGTWVGFGVLNIAFDTVNNIYPTKIKVGNTEYQNDNSIFTFNANGATSVKVYFNNLNVGNNPLIITGIYTGLSIDINNRNLKSMSVEIFDRSDLKFPSFGIISNKGEIEFTDNDGTVLNYAEQNLLKEGANCLVYLNNTLVANSSTKIADFETAEWNYDNDNRIVNVSLKDELEEWQDIEVAEISYNPKNAEEKPFSWLYEHLWGITSKNYSMWKLEDLDENTQNILKNTYIKYPLLKKGNLWQQWTKLCEVCGLHIYKTRNGTITCAYNWGN